MCGPKKASSCFDLSNYSHSDRSSIVGDCPLVTNVVVVVVAIVGVAMGVDQARIGADDIVGDAGDGADDYFGCLVCRIFFLERN